MRSDSRRLRGAESREDRVANCAPMWRRLRGAAIPRRGSELSFWAVNSGASSIVSKIDRHAWSSGAMSEHAGASRMPDGLQSEQANLQVEQARMMLG